MKNDSEILQIESELAILRARYALYGRCARILRGFFIFFLPLVALACAIRLFLFDAFYGLFFAGMMVVLAAAIVLCLKSSSIRWIDLASQYFGNKYLSAIYNPYFFYPDARPMPRSDAEFLEIEIADREKRLSELERAPPA
jgi:hypothetical protein